eukprot:2292527-Prymnesium_polylepis.2
MPAAGRAARLLGPHRRGSERAPRRRAHPCALHRRGRRRARSSARAPVAAFGARRNVPPGVRTAPHHGQGMTPISCPGASDRLTGCPLSAA